MKNIYYSLFCLFLPLLIIAQDGINWIYGTDHYTEGTNVAVSPDGGWLVSGFSAGRNNSSLMFPIIGQYASDEWNQFNLDSLIEHQGELGQISEVVYDPINQQYYFVLGQGVCDVGIPSELVSFGAQGTWQTAIYYDYTQAFALCAIPGEGIIWSPQLNPDLLWQQGPEHAISLTDAWDEENDLFDLQYWRTRTFLAQTQNQVLAFTFDTTGATLEYAYTDLNENSTIQAFEVINEDQIVIVQNDSIKILDATLSPIAQAALVGNSTPYLAADDEQIYLLQTLAEDELYAFFLDHNLTETGRTIIEPGAYEIGDLAGNDGQIVIVGAQEFLPQLWPFEAINSQLFLRTYTVNGPDFPDGYDVEAVSIMGNDISFTPFRGKPCGSGEVMNLMVKVKNNSSIPISEVLLKFEFDPDQICPAICDPYVTQTRHHIDLNLQPGETISLPFDNLRIDGLGLEDEFELCINITTPNHPMEMNLSNNSSCETVIITDTNEQSTLDENGLQVFPNPVKDILKLELPAKIEMITIYDNLGRMVWQEQSPDIQSQYELQTHKLPRGIYYIRISNNQQVYSGSFIRQ